MRDQTDHAGQRLLLDAAQAGDEGAYAELVEPHRRPLHAHCYRLHSIATNVCLRMIERRPARVLPIDYGPPANPHTGLGPPLVESTWIQPYPDARFGVADGLAGPDARYERREAGGRAFIAALQH